jgi:hypothetical protein
MSPAMGAPGTSVTLRGSFPEGTTVHVGPLPVRPDVANRRMIRFQVPALAPGSHPVSVLEGRQRASAGTLRVIPAGRGERADRLRAGPNRGRWAFRERAVVTSFWPSSGPPGTLVTIRGQRFDPSVRLVLGGELVRATTVTPTSITFAVPPRSQGGLLLLREPRHPDFVIGTFEVGRPLVRPRPPPRASLREVARRRWLDRRGQLAATEAARLEALRAQEEALRLSRAERQRERRAAVRAEFERAFLDLQATQDELSLHAERGARLERMSRLAEARLDEALGVRIGVLLQREERRHQQRMNDLRAAFRAAR